MKSTADAQDAAASASADGFAARYEICELLGQGGMACVYRAVDRALDREVALKRLLVDSANSHYATVAALFEREFHTLAQLRHPHVIAVYDYGVRADGNPFYTMELLDGGDLRDRTPLDWPHACRLMFDVCSALALVHSRRLLHRDISPRNIRCTRDGRAKLIDFGALSPMSDGGTAIVGTPALIAPETVQRLALDARTDLYSLGVTLYYALTGRMPYPARSFADLKAAWRTKPPAPSALVADIPTALDDLVLALISVEPELRPRGAFDVMQQLAACAGLHIAESEAVSRAYLSTPTLVGREDALGRLRELLRLSRLRRVAGVMIDGPAGGGRSRLLDACALEAQTLGFTLLRATASGAREAFSTARSLANHLLDALPIGSAAAEFPELFASAPAEPANDTSDAGAVKARPSLRNLAVPALERAPLQSALRQWLQNVSSAHPLLIAVDDVHKIDPSSAALLAELLDATTRGSILIALTADSDAPVDEALGALARRCAVLPLAALTPEQTRALLASLFGDVANLEMLAGEIHRVALGNPRQTLELAQHLVDGELIRYSSGHWTLPNLLTADDLPRSAADAMRARIARLSFDARFLAEAQALAFYETLSDPDYRMLLPSVSSQDLELALSELLTAHVIVQDGPAYMLANRVWAAAFLAGLDPEQTRTRHLALAAMYAATLNFAFIHHAFLGGLDRQALEALDLREDTYRTEADFAQLVEQNAGKLMWCYPRAIATAQALGRSARNVADLRRWQYLGSIVSPDPPDLESARRWFEQLADDSGLRLYQQDTVSTTPAERLTGALQTAFQRYLATPEHERVYPVDHAIRLLGEYVVISIGLGGRTLDAPLMRDLPDALEPFVALSPLLDVIWNNSLATRSALNDCRHELARERWQATLTKLDAIVDPEVTFINSMGNAIAYAIGMMEVQLGLESAAHWAERLDRDPFQRVSALNLRTIVRLEQGDADGAERLRRQAEVLALQMRTPQMFEMLLTLELEAHAKSRDLAGVARVIEQMKPLAARYPAWRTNLMHGEASFQLVRGDYAAATAKFEACIEGCQLDERGLSSNLYAWIASQAGLAECLLGLGRDEQARTMASRALAVCEQQEIGTVSFDLIRMLASAEARLGDPRGAERLDALIAHQLELGSTGLRLGLSYEARARIAIGAADAEGFEQFAELTARQYRRGARTPLAARYQRLLNEAARAGLRVKASFSDFEASADPRGSTLGGSEVMTVVMNSIAESSSAAERARIALQMICDAHGASRGHLYLIAPSGPVLCASQAADAPAAELAERVSRYVDDKRQSAADMDEMETGDVQDDGAFTSLIQTESGSYELLPLGCLVGAISTLAGVAVIETTGARARDAKQARLLNALAQTLLHVGDCQGLRLMDG